MSETAATTIWSLADIKAAFSITNSNEDARLVRIADGICQFIERVTSRFYVTRTITEVQDGHGSRLAFLERVPVTAFTSIVILRYPSDATTETMDPLRYNVNLRTGKIWAHNDIFTRGNGNLTFTYQSGYGTKGDSTLPAWAIGLDMIRIVFDEERTGAKGGTQVSIGPQTYIVKSDWPVYVKTALKNLAAPQV